MDALQLKAWDMLTNNRAYLTRQQVRTFKGQILSGNPEGAIKGIKRKVGKI